MIALGDLIVVDAILCDRRVDAEGGFSLADAPFIAFAVIESKATETVRTITKTGAVVRDIQQGIGCALQTAIYAICMCALIRACGCRGFTHLAAALLIWGAATQANQEGYCRHG